MSGACRGLLCFTNSLTFLTSLPILFLALIINSAGHSKCISYIQGPITVIGILLLVVSLMGMIGSCCRVTFMLWLYEWVLFLCIIFLLCFTMLASMGVHKSSYKGEPAETIHLRQFSDWLQLNVVDKEDWNAIRSCLSETLFCEGEKQPGAVKGCCKPPAYCGYELKNGTTWTVPKSGLRSKDHDCVTWSNDPRIMCYDCDSCKAGFLARIKNNWRKLSAFFSCLIAFLVINFVIGCCAFRGSRGVDQYQKHGNSN
ncbi:Tetraspanin-8 [Vitis vinifera]|uniref:Tetraspanin-8 n=2 Tax=Vitis vinifera TaxID=29760 RepID=A0A438EB68_VITVI|nr:Tetraspanin-8 [Vitis vinifera]RVX06434.1 Tetraspanin-8 [Vitis vinifera]|eukprot:XP_002279204.1 PREDICTED: tetraspanin-8-like [Vitis vinifera]